MDEGALKAALSAVGLWLALAVFAGPVPAGAATIEGIDFAPSVEAGGTTLTLHSVGLLRYRYIIKAYVAALYLGPGVGPAQIFDDVPKRLELHYFYSIHGPDFAMAADKFLAANVEASALPALRPRIAALHALYRDVKPGDRYALTYLPGRGTELALNGTPLGVVEGADFAAAYFSIWLGAEPINEPLRDALLGRS